LSKLDRVSVLPFGGGASSTAGSGPARLPPARGKGNIFKVLRFLSSLDATGPTDLSAALRGFTLKSPRKGLAVVLSDFYDPAGYEEGLNQLRYHRFEPTVVQVYTEAEARPQLKGDLELYDVEGGLAREVTISERVLTAYARAHQAYCDELASFCGRRGIGYFRAETQVPFEETVLRIFRAGGFLS
jgi:hypothetical protein